MESSATFLQRLKTSGKNHWRSQPIAKRTMTEQQLVEMHHNFTSSLH